MNLISRRRFIQLAGCGGALATGGSSYMHFVEPGWFEVHEETVPIRLPPGSRPLRLLHLSDFHASSAVPWSLIEEGIDLGLALAPDLICLTGDFITDKLPDLARYIRLLKRLSRAAPVYAVPGNHDGGDWAVRQMGFDNLPQVRTMLEDAGIILLENRSTTLSLANQTRLELIGVGDFWGDDFSPVLAFDKARGNLPTIVLSHNPDSKTKLLPYTWDLLLCGHTHGGQLRIPITGWTPFAPVRDKRYVKGLHLWSQRYLHVTTGVGNLHGARFNCRPQVSLLRLEPQR